MKQFLFTMILGLFVNQIFAKPIDSTPFKVCQPNGDSLIIFQYGDEYGSWYETLDGYVIEKDSLNNWVYVKTDNDNNLVLTNQIVNNISIPSGIDLNSIYTAINNRRQLIYNSLNDDLLLSPNLEDEETAQAVAQGEVFNISQAKAPAQTEGEINVLTILVQFQDVKFEHPTSIKSYFENLMEGENFKHPSNGNIITGSVREYWEEASYGQLIVNSTVVGPYTANFNRAFYGTNWIKDNPNSDAMTFALVYEAVCKAARDVNMSHFDNNNDGIVDFVHVVFAGCDGTENKQAIWPHKCYIPGILRDGVWISKYIVTPEKENNRYASIGTICHEMGHTLGAPDFYDTDGNKNGGYFKGTGLWDLMKNGNVNNSGHSPAHPNPYIKTMIYGWATAKELSGNNKLYTLKPSELDGNSIYKLSTSTPGEYYLLENRQNENLKGTGLVIYHVHSDISYSDINIGHPQKMYVVDASNNLAKPTGSVASYDTINSINAPFRSTDSKNIYFTSTSLPSNCAWDGTPTQNKDVCFISEELVNGEMCIKFVLNPAIEGPDVLCDSAIYSLKHVPSDATIEWTYVGAGYVSNSGIPFYITSGQGTKNARYKRGSVLKNVIDIPGPVNPFPWASLNQTAEPLALKSVPYEGTGTIKVNITFRGETYTLTKDVYMPGTVEIDDLGLGLSNPWIAGTRKVFTLASPTDIPNYSDVKWDVNIVGGNSFSSYGASVAITPSSNVTTVSITATYTRGCDGNNSHTITIPVTTRPSLSFANPASGNVEISVVEGNNAETQQTMSISQSAPYTGAYRLELWHDVYGKVRELDVPENTSTITMNLDGLNSGVYVLRLIIDNQIVETSQLIIK